MLEKCFFLVLKQPSIILSCPSIHCILVACPGNFVMKKNTETEMPSNLHFNSLGNLTEAHKLAHPTPLTSCNPFWRDVGVGTGRGRSQPLSHFLMIHDKSTACEVQPCYQLLICIKFTPLSTAAQRYGTTVPPHLA